MEHGARAGQGAPVCNPVLSICWHTLTWEEEEEERLFALFQHRQAVSSSQHCTLSRARVQMSTAVAQWRSSSSRVFPESLLLPFVDFPVHKVHQENCNYGALQSAESCADLSFQGAFPTSGFKCLVHRNQPASHCIPDL
ncbi:hypothetical protein EYF80_002149 [Liparis tanakae]|uniref:Uncharacterized protein n=1 Tax=Liparis tanakae TaxID=230148 RepID=A0A4Z2JDT1_9TELE|nr:hypothetical protein EYF80_002149 [Liparis tanakae]